MQHTFSLGQQVRLVEPNSPTYFSPGQSSPEDEVYTVNKVEDVSTACNCGCRDDDDQHYDNCRVFALNQTGHPQLVTIQSSRGAREMSGALLKPA